MPWLIALLFLLGLLLLWLAGRQQSSAGIPQGRVIYIDPESLRSADQALFDPQTGLTGKPDFILRQGRAWIPVELKSRRAPLQPFPSHVIQLAAYCFLLQAIYGRRPPYGVVRYRDKSFALDYDGPMETALLKTLRSVRAAGEQEQNRSHASSSRCRACAYRSACDQSLF